MALLQVEAVWTYCRQFHPGVRALEVWNGRPLAKAQSKSWEYSGSEGLSQAVAVAETQMLPLETLQQRRCEY